MSQPYDGSDLANAEGAKIAPFRRPKSLWRRGEKSSCVGLNGIFYHADNGIQWRLMNHFFATQARSVAVKLGQRSTETTRMRKH